MGMWVSLIRVCP